MRKRTKIIVLVACTACVVLAIVKVTEDPHYKGASLTKWLNIYSAHAQCFWLDPHPQLHDWESPEAKEAADAVRAIRSQALPVLSRWIRFQPPLWKTLVFPYTTALPAWLRNSAPVQWLDPNHGSERPQLALVGFVILGSNAAPAIPMLAKMAEDPAGNYDLGLGRVRERPSTSTIGRDQLR